MGLRAPKRLLNGLSSGAVLSKSRMIFERSFWCSRGKKYGRLRNWKAQEQLLELEVRLFYQLNPGTVKGESCLYCSSNFLFFFAVVVLWRVEFQFKNGILARTCHISIDLLLIFFCGGGGDKASGVCVAFDSKKMKTMSLHTRKEEGRQEGNEMCLLPLSSSYARSFKHRVATTAVSQSSFLGFSALLKGK